MGSNGSVSIYDVAKAAGVSIATVSRVLNNNSNVSDKTKEKVLNVLKELNYQPSSIARAMVNKKMLTIGILTVDIRSQNYNIAAYTIERTLANMGYSAIICNTFGSTEDNIKSIRMLLDKGVSGFICIGSVFDKTFNETSIISDYSHVPFVVSNYQIEADNVCCVDFDESAGIEKAILHFVDRKRKSIYFVRDVDSFSANKKAKCLLRQLQLHGLEQNKGHIIDTTRSVDGGKQAVDTILRSGKPVDAILFNSDIVAIGGMKRLTELGYRVPEDVSVIGYNDTLYAQCSTPTLTSVSTNFETVGRLCVTLLMGLIDGTNTMNSISIKPELVIRESS